MKKILTTISVFMMAVCAFATDVTSYAVEATTGTLSANGKDWTASALTYLAPASNDSLNRSETGWYAGIKRTWALSYTGSGLSKKYTGTKANTVKATFSDNAGRSIAEYNVYNSLGTSEQSPDGSGVQNGTQLGGLTLYMKTTDWNVWVTPDIMKSVSEKGEDYVATLTLNDGSTTETYTITVPCTLELVDDQGVKWWPEPEHDEPVSIEDAEITLSATEIITRGETVGISISQVTVDQRLLTEGTDYTVDESSVLEATAIGEYTVTLSGTGNYTGTATATWKIVEPTGEFAEDAMSIREGDPAYGSISAETPRRLDITDSTKLVYKNDELGERWEAAVEISWPHSETAFDTYIILPVPTKVQYIDAQHASVRLDEEVAWGDEIVDGRWTGLSATETSASYYEVDGLAIKTIDYSYFDKLTWTVAITPADIEAAIESGAKHLEYSIVCGSVAWGDETEGNVEGIADTEFTVSMSLAKVFLLDGEGHQVYPAHEHSWSIVPSEDGSLLAANCKAEGCYLAETTGELRLEIVSKDSSLAEYTEGHYRDGVAAEALLKGVEDFYPTGASIGDIRYFAAGGGELASAPVEPGRYSAVAEVSLGENVWQLKVDGLEILAGEASVNGVHVKDASEYLERATGDAMQIAAGKSYTASKAYQTPAKYGILNLTCGVKTYDLAGFTVTAAVDQPFFENAGRLVITDSSEDATGAIAANQASAEDTLIVNTGTLTIEGGTFRGSIVNDGGTVTITGGKFSVKPEADFVGEGYDIVKRGDLWSVEKHEHDYRFVVVGGRLVIATCCNVLVDDALQISHCDSRQLVGILGLRKSFTGITKGVPALSVDYDRKEHPAEFYAINMTTLNAVITDASLLSIIKDVVENVDFANIAETDVLNLLSVLAQNDGFADLLKNILGIYVEADGFENLTGCTLGKVEYTMDGKALEGVPVEAGDYTATISITLPGGNEKTVKGSFRINEKELPIETEGHDTHVWTFKEDGARITATCPGNLLRGIKCNASPMAIELVPSVEGGRKVYDAKPLEVAVSNLNTFVINTDATLGDVIYLAADGTELESAPVEPGEYTAKVEMMRAALPGLVEVKRTATLPLVIEEKTPSRPFEPCAFKIPGGMCSPHWGVIGCDGKTAYVVNSTNLLYDAAEGRWAAPLTVDWPDNIDGLLLTPAVYTDPAHAKVETDCGEVVLVTSFFKRPLALCPEEYVVKVLWIPSFTLDDIKAAADAGQDELVFELTVGSNAWECDPFGLKATTYRLVVPIKGFVIDDEPIDWYWIEYRGNGATTGEMGVERRLSVDATRLTRSAFASEGLNQLGWSFDEKAEGLAEIDFADYQVVTGDEFTVGETNVIYAIWTTNVVICSDIVNTNASQIASIKLYGVGKTDKESAVEGRAFGSVSPWRYVFEVAAPGFYDVVVGFEDGEGGESVVTTLVQAEEGDSTTEKHDAEPVGSPVGGISSVVDNSEAGDYSVVAGGLDKIAASDENLAEVAANKNVEICFKVSDMPADGTTSGYKAIEAVSGTSFIKPLDFSFIRYVDGVANKLHDISGYGTTVTAIMPFEVGGRRNFRVVRYHEDTEGDPTTGSVTALPEGAVNANALGEYFAVDTASNELVISGAKFSTYALLWDGAEVDQKSMVWHVDWLSGMYVPSIELEVAAGKGWANSVSNMCFLLEKRDWAQLWDAKSNSPVTTTVDIGGKTFYKVSLKDRFDVAGADSDKWGAVFFDSTWINAQLSEILLYAPKFWPQNPKDVTELDSLIAYVSYESYGCESSVKVVANDSLGKKLSLGAIKSAKPASVENLNTSLAVGAVVTDDSQPYCRLVEFAVEGGVASGRVEVGAGDTQGSLGDNAEVHILGVKNLGDEFEEIAQVDCDESGSFSVSLPEGYKFFKVRLGVSETIR